jgi:Zn-dependent protease with chaperone function
MVRAMTMQQFSAILYGAGQPVGGAPVAARFGADSLHVDQPALGTDAAAISVRVGGFEHDVIFLSWRGADDIDYSLKPADKAATQYVVANAPPSLQALLKPWHQRRRAIRGVWSTIGAVAALLVIGAGLLWWRYDDAVSWLASRVSIANEEKLGTTVLKQLEADGEIIKEGPAVEALQRIGKRLVPASQYKYQWFIQRDNTVNAFALPGGVVIVNSGLIKKVDSADELAAVLAHEVQHVEQRHALKNMINNLGWTAGLLAIVGDVNAAAVLVMHQLGNSYFSRGVEEEADRLGFKTLVDAKIAPQGMVTLLQKLAKETSGDGPEWLSSHPDTARRVREMQKMVAENPCADCETLAFDWPAIQGDKALRKKAED